MPLCVLRAFLPHIQIITTYLPAIVAVSDRVLRVIICLQVLALVLSAILQFVSIAQGQLRLALPVQAQPTFLTLLACSHALILTTGQVRLVWCASTNATTVQMRPTVSVA
jgi:hypothetical protein